MSRLCLAIVCVLCLQEPGNLAAVEGTDKITTFAGSETGGFSGDGGPANEAKLTTPGGLFLDERGSSTSPTQETSASAAWAWTGSSRP